MPPKSIKAYRAAAEQDAPGPLVCRVEAAVDTVTDAALQELEAELIRLAYPKNGPPAPASVALRSKAIRLVMRKGFAALVAERTAAA